MKFLADVNIPLPLIRYLISRGHDVQDARVNYPHAKDITLIKFAKKENLIILTRDKDFIELTKYPKHKVPVIVIRLKNQQTVNIISHIEALFANISEDSLMRSITIVSEEKADSFIFD